MPSTPMRFIVPTPKPSLFWYIFGTWIVQAESRHHERCPVSVRRASPSSREISRWAGCLQPSRSLPACPAPVPGLTTCHAPPRHPGMTPWFPSSSADYHPPRPEPWACDELVTARARSKGSPWWVAAVPPLSGGAATPALAAVAPRPLPPLPREVRDVARAAPTRWGPWK